MSIGPVSSTLRKRRLPKEKQKELFERFNQSAFSRNSIGIGLHLTNELVRVHHGSIGYEENPKGGSIFTVSHRN